jgi:hypothetical protein
MKLMRRKLNLILSNESRNKCTNTIYVKFFKSPAYVIFLPRTMKALGSNLVSDIGYSDRGLCIISHSPPGKPDIIDKVVEAVMI